MNVLVLYADDNFANSRWLMKLRARRLGIFQKIMTFSPSDLPESLRGNDRRGPGSRSCFLWKPYILKTAMDRVDIGDVIYYIDAGCILQRSHDWEMYRQLIQGHNGIFFSYRTDHDYHWDKYKHNSVIIKHWTKPLTVKYFQQNYAQGSNIMEEPSLWAGFLILRKTAYMPLLDTWASLALDHPELFQDPADEELRDIDPTYCCHRHDQSVLTYLVHIFKEKEMLAVIPETSESCPQKAGVVAARYRVGRMPLLPTIKFRLYWWLKEV